MAIISTERHDNDSERRSPSRLVHRNVTEAAMLSEVATQVDGQILFENFVLRDSELEGLSDVFHVEPGHVPDNMTAGHRVAQQGPFTISDPDDIIAQASIPEGYKNNIWSRCGADLLKIAKDFEKSRQGEEIRLQAETVNLRDINQERFWNLLIGLFSEGFNSERVVALFIFCKSLIIRAAKQKTIELVKDIFIWSLKYIKEKVSKWVNEHGGWERVLGSIRDSVMDIFLRIWTELSSTSAMKILAVTLSVATVIGLSMLYVRRN